MSTNTYQAPRSGEVRYTCDCGRDFTATLHHAVNVTLDPALRYTLLAGRLNVATCPNCGRQIHSDLPFLYHDMERGLFAYVHPRGDMPEEERDAVLEELRRVYTNAVRESSRLAPPRRPSGSRPPAGGKLREGGTPSGGMPEPDAPPMQVIFGMDDLIALVDSLLEPEERLGHIALHSDSPDPAVRARFLSVADQLAQQMGCVTESEDHGARLTVDIYGPRQRIGQLVRVLHATA